MLAAVGDLGCGLHSLRVPAAPGTLRRPVAQGARCLGRRGDRTLCRVGKGGGLRNEDRCQARTQITAEVGDWRLLEVRDVKAGPTTEREAWSL